MYQSKVCIVYVLDQVCIVTFDVLVWWGGGVRRHLLSSPTGPAEHWAGGSRPRSLSSWNTTQNIYTNGKSTVSQPVGPKTAHWTCVYTTVRLGEYSLLVGRQVCVSIPYNAHVVWLKFNATIGTLDSQRLTAIDCIEHSRVNNLINLSNTPIGEEWDVVEESVILLQWVMVWLSHNHRLRQPIVMYTMVNWHGCERDLLEIPRLDNGKLLLHKVRFLVLNLIKTGDWSYFNTLLARDQGTSGIIDEFCGIHTLRHVTRTYSITPYF